MLHLEVRIVDQLFIKHIQASRYSKYDSTINTDGEDEFAVLNHAFSSFHLISSNVTAMLRDSHFSFKAERLKRSVLHCSAIT